MKYLFLILILSGCGYNPQRPVMLTSIKDSNKEIKELERLKLLEIYNHNKEVYEIIKRVYDNNKAVSSCELKEAELKLKLSEIDLKIKDLEIQE